MTPFPSSEKTHRSGYVRVASHESGVREVLISWFLWFLLAGCFGKLFVLRKKALSPCVLVDIHSTAMPYGNSLV
jgi:hypothetical protein